MTGNQINSFVGNLVEMAKAYEELPGVQAELSAAHGTLEVQSNTISRLEQRIMELKGEVEAAHANTHRVEAERDEAIGSFLAADNRAMRALDFIKAGFGSAGAFVQSLEPPKPEPKADEVKPVEPMPPEMAKIGENTYFGAAEAEPAPVHPFVVDPLAESPLHPAPQGERALEEPASSGHALTPTDGWAPSADNTASSEASASGLHPTPNEPPAAPDASHGPYHGRKYVQVPGFISRQDWVNGGGTEADYDWRP